MGTQGIAVLAIGRRGWVEGYPALPLALEVTALGYHRAWWHASTFFHADGYRYAVSAAVPARPLGAWSRMLAATVYNPRVRVQFEYERARRYTLDDLKAAFGAALEADDDVLTQFHEPEELRGKLAAAASFAEVTAVLELSRTETDAA
jgi:hypothetical protein